jgi:hypothetical protein
VRLITKEKKVKHTARKIDTGLYEYRGHTIENMQTRADSPYPQWAWGLIYVREDGLEWSDVQDASNTLADAKAWIDGAFDEDDNLMSRDWLASQSNDKIKLEVA